MLTAEQIAAMGRCVTHERAAAVRQRPEFREWRGRLRTQYARAASEDRRAAGYARHFGASGGSYTADQQDRREAVADRVVAGAVDLMEGYDAERRRYEQAVNRAVRDLYGPGRVASSFADPYGEAA